MAETLLRLQAVMDRTGIKRSKIYALIGAGQFPQPMKIDGCAVWPASDVDQWIERRVARFRAESGAQAA